MNSYPLSRKAAAAITIAGLLLAGVPVLADTAPTPPTVNLTSASSQSPTATSDNPIVVTATVSQDVSDFTQSDFNVSGGSVQSFAGSGNSYTINILPGDPDTNHPRAAGTVTVNIDEHKFASGTNAASNTLTFAYDPSAASSTATSTGGGSGDATSSPSITITSGPDEGSSTSSTMVTFDFATDATSTVCTFGTTFDCGSPVTLGPLGDSAYTFSVTATNSFGSTTVVRDFTVDTSTSTATTTTATSTDPNLPALTITGGPADGSSINATSTTFSFTTSATTTCMFGSGTFPCYDSSLAQQFVTLGNDNPAGLGDSAYTFSVTAVNGFGSTTASRNFTVDTVAPVIAFVSVATSSDGSPNSYTYTSNEAGMPAFSSGCAIDATTTPMGTSTLAITPTTTAGTYDCSLTLSDAAGNVSNALVLPEFTVAAPASSGGGGSSGGGSSSNGSGGGSQVFGSSPTAPGFQTGGTAENTVIPTVPAGTPAPTPVDTSGSTGDTVTDTSGDTGPGVVDNSALTPDQGQVLGAQTTATDTASDTGAIIDNSGAAAAAAASGASVPGWAWLILALLMLAGLLYWAYRRSVTYETTR